MREGELGKGGEIDGDGRRLDFGGEYGCCIIKGYT